MAAALYQPGFVLKPEYRLTEDEKTAYMHDQFQFLYQSALTQIPDLPYETMSRIIIRPFRESRYRLLHKGSGLGMAITHDIVIAHGGEIKVRSEVGQGTIAEIKLRLA
ncbi:Histidine kinase-, DNA gyrase B-, and HSP90-like ATPase [Paenibacillus sp. cl141a]|nr:Histidine kinase-, DNA gyrase B-, and HSP90-like ATPase [Paenibacillus sp. cl141a]